MFVVLMNTYKLELLYTLNENTDFQKHSHPTNLYLLFSKMEIKSFRSQAEIDFPQNGAQNC